MSTIKGTYVGQSAVTLASGRPVGPGDVVVLDSDGEDAHLLDAGLIASQSEVAEKSSGSQRRKRETDS